MKGLVLTSEQRERLEVEAREVDEAHIYRRAAALLAVDRGYPVAEVAGVLGVTRQTIYNWLRTYGEAGGAVNLDDAPRPGRPSVWSSDLASVLEQTLRASPAEAGCPGPHWTPRLLQTRLASISGVRVSHETLRRRLRGLGYVWSKGRYVIPESLPSVPKAGVPVTVGAPV